mmetsp:Transcript_13007/g.39278  ORF Transcript_13007/g.39278 Transcript_13007/m.39278 type:complete len:365 (+) Transcript_13007:478-1572(+)
MLGRMSGSLERVCVHVRFVASARGGRCAEARTWVSSEHARKTEDKTKTEGGRSREARARQEGLLVGVDDGEFEVVGLLFLEVVVVVAAFAAFLCVSPALGDEEHAAQAAAAADDDGDDGDDDDDRGAGAGPLLALFRGDGHDGIVPEAGPADGTGGRARRGGRRLKGRGGRAEDAAGDARAVCLVQHDRAVGDRVLLAERVRRDEERDRIVDAVRVGRVRRDEPRVVGALLEIVATGGVAVVALVDVEAARGARFQTSDGALDGDARRAGVSDQDGADRLGDAGVARVGLKRREVAGRRGDEAAADAVAVGRVQHEGPAGDGQRAGHGEARDFEVDRGVAVGVGVVRRDQPRVDRAILEVVVQN